MCSNQFQGLFAGDLTEDVCLGNEKGLWLADSGREGRVNAAGQAGRDQIIRDLESQGN